MKDCLITVAKIANHEELSKLYELPQTSPCDMREGQVFLSHNALRPDGFCEEAWKTLAPFVLMLANGAKRLYGNWMKDPCSAMISCNDGFRPVSFYIQAIDK